LPLVPLFGSGGGVTALDSTAGSRWAYSRFTVGLQQVHGGLTAGSRWAYSRFTVGLQQVHGRLTAGTR
jgi:hypothetical protein